MSALDQARAAVESDLGPAYADLVPPAVEHRRWWLEQWPDGEAFVLCLLAQDVQEAVHDVDPLWPACLEATCPEVGAHPLFVEPDLGPDPFWVCHTTGLPVCAVGDLQS